MSDGEIKGVQVRAQGCNIRYMVREGWEILTAQKNDAADLHRRLTRLPGFLGYDDSEIGVTDVQPGEPVTYFYADLTTAASAAVIALNNDITVNVVRIYADVIFNMIEED